MEIAYPNSPRIGQFRVLYQTLRDDGPMFAALLALCIVIRVDECESGRGKVWVCASPLFDELKEAEEIPEYRLEFSYDRPFENPEWEARRVESGKFRFAAFRKIIVRVPPLQMGVAPHGAQLH